MKEWTVETLLSQLRLKVRSAGLGDIFDPTDEVSALTVTDLIDALKDADFRKRMAQIEGQQAIYIDDRGNVTTGDAPKGADEGAKRRNSKGDGEDNFAMASDE